MRSCWTTTVRKCSTRVRFAPSPTGHLHLGGLRTAFYNYLFAKKQRGSFIIRLEDTDRTRIVPGSAENIEKMLRWSGLIPDESPVVGGKYGPYVQSQRLDLYRDHCQDLLRTGVAYRCFCSEKRLELLKREANRMKRANKYDRRCLQLSNQEIQDKLGAGESFTVRFKLRPFTEGYKDLIYGHSLHNVFELEGDPIILKSDGYPTYHFANVIDDHLMKITHVFRGVEWQVSTPKHIMLYEAFGWKPPEFAHLPLIVNADGTKLSKRQNDIHVQYYKDNGYFPEAVLNFMATVGGGFESRDQSYQAIYSLSELIEKFNLNLISTYSGRLEKERLDFYNRQIIKSMLNDLDGSSRLINLVKEVYPELKDRNDQTLLNDIRWASDRINTLLDLKRDTSVSFVWFEPSDFSKIDLDLDTFTAIKDLAERNFNKDHHLIISELRTLSKTRAIKYANVMGNVRIALCGDKQGPPIKEIIEILGMEKVIKRLYNVIEHMKTNLKIKRV